MSGILGGRGLPPGIGGYVAGTEFGNRNAANQLGMLQGVLALQNAMIDQQLHPLRVQQLEQAIRQSAARDAALQRLAGAPGIPSAQAGMAQGAQQGDVGPTVTNAQRGAAFSRPTDADYQAALAAGIDAKTVTAMRDIAYPKMEVSNNYAFDPRNVGPGFMPSLNISREGQASLVRVGPDGLPVVTAPTGAMDTYAGYKDIANRSEAQYRPFTIQPTSPGESPRIVSTLDVVRPPQGSPVPQVVPGAPRLSDIPYIPPAQQRQTQANLDAGLGPTGGPAIPTSRVAGVPSGMSADTQAGVSERESGARTLGKNDAELVNGYRQKIPALNASLNRLDRLEALNADERTYAAAGAEFKTQLGSIAQALGIDVGSVKTANSELYMAQIGELMKDRLASKDYGSGSGVSNLDLLAAKQPLPELAKTQQGRSLIIQAIRADTQTSLQDMNAARSHYDRSLSLRGFQYPSEVNRQIQETRPGPAPQAPRGRVVKWSELGS